MTFKNPLILEPLFILFNEQNPRVQVGRNKRITLFTTGKPKSLLTIVLVI